MTLKIAPSRKVLVGLFITIAVLALLGAGVQIIKYYKVTFPLVGTFEELFDMDRESNIPAWFNSGLLLLAGVLLLLIGGQRRKAAAPFARHWTGLGVIFTLLSMDEIVAIHERFTHGIGRNIGRIGGFFTFLWVIPGIIFVVVVGLAYLKFLLRLPRRTRTLFVLSAVVYLGGVLGVEMCSAYARATWGLRSGAYFALVVLEEALEMSGVALFIHALLDHVGRHLNEEDGSELAA
jgi:hypothetical protein